MQIVSPSLLSRKVSVHDLVSEADDIGDVDVRVQVLRLADTRAGRMAVLEERH